MNENILPFDNVLINVVTSRSSGLKEEPKNEWQNAAYWWNGK